MMYTVFSFFIIWSGYHRALHSFPTRRSSDLGPEVRWEMPTDTPGSSAPPLPRTRSIRVYRDRKSTRLNSSHANISYAVFCLKKKKKKKHDAAIPLVIQNLRRYT